MRRWLAGLLLLLALTGASAAAAHEVRPAYLEIDQLPAGAYTVTWKQPVVGQMALHLAPHLSGGWLEARPTEQYASAGFLIRGWKIRGQGADALEGQTVSIEGLKDTIPDVFVRIRTADGRTLDTILHPEEPSFRVALHVGQAARLSAFLRLGIEHILTGPDHLLFVLGLILMVRNRWALLKTVSAFTLAHSLTLAAAVLGWISLPSQLIDALIALSILFVAPEALRAQRGETSLAIRFPWVVAFCFGLLHGLGFASGLVTLGLDRAALAAALVLFNLGVEVGQLTFIAAVLLSLAALRRLPLRWPRPALLAPSYLIGTCGAAWALQNASAFFGLLP
jgi:hypothetical protein